MENSQTIESRKQRAAQAAGLEVTKMQQIRFDIGKMLEAGLLVDIDLHGFSALKARVSWAELGVSDDSELKARMNPGTKYLAPAEYVKALNSLEARFRQLLDRFSYDLEGFKPWRWMAFDDYPEWKGQWFGLCSALTDLRIDIIAHYDDIVAENRAYFQCVAQRAWKSIQAQLTPGAVVQMAGKVFTDYAEFEEHIVTTALAKLPSVEFMHSGIFADYKTGYLITSAETSAHYQQAEIAGYEKSKAEAEARMAWQAEREKDLELNAAERALQAKAEAVKQAELEHARQQLATMKSPIDELMGQFRARIYEKVVKAAASLGKNGSLPAKTATMLSGLSALYSTLSHITEDTEMESVLRSLQHALDKVPADGKEKYDIGAVEAALRSVVSLTEDAAKQAARASVQSSRAGVLEL